MAVKLKDGYLSESMDLTIVTGHFVWHVAAEIFEKLLRRLSNTVFEYNIIQIYPHRLYKAFKFVLVAQ